MNVQQPLIRPLVCTNYWIRRFWPTRIRYSRRLREADPVHWDSFLHAWVVTGYEDVINVMLKCSADRTPSPQQLEAMGMRRNCSPSRR